VGVRGRMSKCRCVSHVLIMFGAHVISEHERQATSSVRTRDRSCHQ
jgi:hypothetical protein